MKNEATTMKTSIGNVTYRLSCAFHAYIEIAEPVTVYGVEYKAASNWWMVDREYMRWVYRTALKAIEQGLSHHKDEKEPALENYRQLVIDTKTNWNRSRAERILSDWGMEVPFL